MQCRLLSQVPRLSPKINMNTDASLDQGTYTLGRFLAHASILCTVMGADQNKESFPYPGARTYRTSLDAYYVL